MCSEPWHLQCEKLMSENADFLQAKMTKLQTAIDTEQNRNPRKPCTHAFHPIASSSGTEDGTGAARCQFAFNFPDKNPFFDETLNGLPPLFHVQKCAQND